VGAVATQAFANTTFGWRGLELLEKGATPDEAVEILLRGDDNPGQRQRQIGIVSADGSSATYTGEQCLKWAGGRHGPNYAIQGNILVGEDVVASMEEAFLKADGTLAERLYKALAAGDRVGRQSAALIVVKEGAGYGGYTDRAIDIRVDDNPDPVVELGRLLKIAMVNYSWNEGWTLFTRKKYGEALPFIEKAAELAPDYGEVLYDLAVIRLAAGDRKGALEALKKAVKLNPKLGKQAAVDDDLKSLRGSEDFRKILK